MDKQIRFNISARIIVYKPGQSVGDDEVKGSREPLSGRLLEAGEEQPQ